MPHKTLAQQRVECHPKNLIFIQSRAETNIGIVDEYAEMMEDGVTFDPVEGIQDENGQIYVWDGYHRGEAAKKVGISLKVNLKRGTRTEAEWLALTANQKHGLRRTNKDKQHVVRQALRHPYGIRLSDREVARHCGVDHKTVGKTRRELETTGEIPQLPKRVIRTTNGKTYEIDTTNIGSKPAQQTVKPSEMPEHVSAASLHPNRNGRNSSSSTRKDQHPEFNSVITLDVAEQPKYQLKPQEFECPRCRQEKIVGINGSRRWCLNCMAEWPTADAFLTEVNAGSEQNSGPLTRRQLQARFQSILARLDEHELSKINIWLDTLEAQLDLAEDYDHTPEAPVSISVFPVLEYA